VVQRHAWLIAWIGAGVLLLVLLAVWQGEAYVEYSDGVYAASARALVHGLVPYRDFAAAQPPGVFYAGAFLLELGDSVGGLRRGLAVVDLVTAALVLTAVWRLTGRRASAGLAGLAALLTPWALREHAQLLPETFAAPLLLGAALAARDKRSSWACGLLGAAAGVFKVAFLLPAIAIAAAAAAPPLALAALAGVTVLELGASLLGFGSAVWRNVFEAQTQTGLSSAHYAGGLWAQAVWNLLPLIVAAALAVRWRTRARSPQLLTAVVAGAVGTLVLLLTLFKRGSYLNVLVVVEPPLLILAACGITWLLERRGAPISRAIVAAAALLVAVQVGSLLSSPRDPGAFARPGAASTSGWQLTDAQVDRQVALIDRCPVDLPFSGPPYLAFAADRRMPGNQPDQFIIDHARVERAFRSAAARDRPRCP
jgi:hypothetical protein